MTVRQGKQMNETFSKNDKQINGLKDSLKFYMESSTKEKLLADSFWAKYSEAKYKHETNLKIFREADKRYEKNIKSYRTDQAILSAGIIVLSCILLYGNSINFHH